jgi:hypothetical protein
MMEQNILIPGLGVHHFLHLSGNEKNEKLIGLLSKLKYEKAIVFVKSASSCVALCKLLNEHPQVEATPQDPIGSQENPTFSDSRIRQDADSRKPAISFDFRRFPTVG